ncbi:MAG: hypothetical protein N3B10_00590 [Armatimonadetes bacterium]|nr:hypothetical protein [Armatimonadota bacterium]
MRSLKLMLVVSILAMGSVAFVHAQQSPLDTVVSEVNFDQVSLQNALAYLLGERGISFEVDPRLSGISVTIHRTNQPLRRILQDIAQQVTAEFVYDEKTNTVHFRFKPYDRVTLKFLNVYDGIMLFGGSIIVPYFSPMSMGGGYGGWGGWGGIGGWGGGGWGGGGTYGAGRRSRGGGTRGRGGGW